MRPMQNFCFILLLEIRIQIPFIVTYFGMDTKRRRFKCWEAAKIIGVFLGIAKGFYSRKQGKRRRLLYFER